MLRVTSVRVPAWCTVPAVSAIVVACTFPPYWADRFDAGGSAGEAPLPDGGKAGAGSGGSAGDAPLSGGGKAGASSGGAAGDAPLQGGMEAGSGSGGAGAPANPPCMQTYPTTIDGLTSRYKEVTTGRSWADAERDCETEGGHLIVIDDGVENDWMTSIAAKFMTDDSFTNQQAWIGLGDSTSEETFAWVTGTPLTLGPWATGEPNDNDDNEDCAQIAASGSWNDDSCDEELAYVCECDGTPSAGLWCDSQTDETCGDCNTACPSDQTCVSSKCE